MKPTKVGRPRSTEADQAISDAVLDLLIEGGIDAVGFEQVARRAGVTRATVYRRYPTRNELLIGAITHSHQQQLDGPGGRLADSADPTIEDMIEILAEVLSRPRERRLLRRISAALPEHPDLFADYREISVDAREQALRDALQAAKDRGEFPPDAEVDTLRILLSGAISYHLGNYPDDTSTADLAGYLRDCLTALGYQQPAAERRPRRR